MGCGATYDRAPFPDGPNLYKGLRAFDAGDADSFAGRERIVADLLRRIGAPGRSGRVVTLVGPSGSGNRRGVAISIEGIAFRKPRSVRARRDGVVDTSEWGST